MFLEGLLSENIVTLGVSEPVIIKLRTGRVTLIDISVPEAIRMSMVLVVIA